MTLIEFIFFFALVALIAFCFPSIMAFIWAVAVFVMQTIVLVFAALAVIVSLNVLFGVLFSSVGHNRQKTWSYA